MSWNPFSSKPKIQQKGSAPNQVQVPRKRSLTKSIYNQGVRFAKKKGEEVSAGMKGMQRRMTNTRASEENGIYKDVIKKVRAILREENINVNRGRRNPENMEELHLNISDVLNKAKKKLNSTQRRFQEIENSKRAYKPRRNRAAPSKQPNNRNQQIATKAQLTRSQSAPVSSAFQPPNPNRGKIANLTRQLAEKQTEVNSLEQNYIRGRKKQAMISRENNNEIARLKAELEKLKSLPRPPP